MIRSSPLGPGAEFDFLRGVFGRAPAVDSAWVAAGPGDDVALLSPFQDAYLAISSDLAVEGVHFRFEWIDEREAGGRAVRAALSDLAGVAAEPVGVLLSASLPAGADPTRAASALVAAAETAASFGAVLLGGDVARGGAEFVLDVVALGRAPRPVLRSGARPGDLLWVTGALGGAAHAVRTWAAGSTPPAGARERFVRPVPRIREARWWTERAVPSAMIDLSDGLVADAGHLAAASGVRVEIDEPHVPIEPGAQSADALTGGEDYELLFAAPPGAVEPRRVEFESAFAVALRCVGRVAVGTGVQVFDARGRPLEIATAGYNHFRDR